MPAVIDASARLPGTPLLVTPAPGSARRDAAGAAELPRRRAAASSARSPSRQRHGRHPGRLEPYSQGDGESFVPARRSSPARPSPSGRRRRAAQRFAYSFIVGDPDPIARLPEPASRPARPGTVLHFALGAGHRPRRADRHRRLGGGAADGDIFLAAYPGPGRDRPGDLRPARRSWSGSSRCRPTTFAANVRVQRYRGQPVLTWWQGTISRHGFGLGEGEIYSTSYRHLATIRAGDGLAEDLHELRCCPTAPP